jgi:hypothetical protein
MSENVVSLSGEPVAEVPYNRSVVDLLNDAIARAKRGEIEHLFIAYTDKDGGAGGTYDGKPSFLLFAAARLQRRIHEYVDSKA